MLPQTCKFGLNRLKSIKVTSDEVMKWFYWLCGVIIFINFSEII